ncbi:MAG: retropepsin-like aspartic protease [Candidatus Daviesbacteria bacterium]|nr:retropepsin-like aspartic protease [Candidatus Daviesbacteria bacterium]
MKFKYRKTSNISPFSKRKILTRPIIPISLRNGEKALRYEALIDSGADFSIFPVEIAKKLNVNIKKAKKIYFSSATGDLVKGTISRIKLDLGRGAFETHIVFADLAEQTGILGQYGFFDKFIVKFDLNKEEIEIKERI